jgi:hypothetical protein
VAEDSDGGDHGSSSCIATGMSKEKEGQFANEVSRT